MNDITRRNVLGVAAGTMAGAVTTTAEAKRAPKPAATPVAQDIDQDDLSLFVKVSAALTGIAEGKLAPSVDPIQVKRDYYKRASKDPGWEPLMRIVRADPVNPAAAAERIMANIDPSIRYLGRSIIIAWYLGVWHDPAELESKLPSPAPEVVSGTAYTQGWTWRVAQAHPMGYSELRFGYWSDEPLPLNDIIKG